MGSAFWIISSSVLGKRMYFEPRRSVIPLQTSWVIFDAVDKPIPNILTVSSKDPVLLEKYKVMVSFLFAGNILQLGDKIFKLI